MSDQSDKYATTMGVVDQKELLLKTLHKCLSGEINKPILITHDTDYAATKYSVE